MANLFSIKEAILNVYHDYTEGEVDEDSALEALGNLNIEFEDKADNYARLIAQVKGEIDTLKAEAKRLAEHAQSRAAFTDRLKKNLESSMIELEKTKFKTALYSYSITKNPPSVKISEESLIPEEFFIQKPPE